MPSTHKALGTCLAQQTNKNQTEAEDVIHIMAMVKLESQAFCSADFPLCCYLKLITVLIPFRWFPGSHTGPHVCYARQGPYTKPRPPKQHIFNTWRNRATTPAAGPVVCGLEAPSDHQEFFQPWWVEGREAHVSIGRTDGQWREQIPGHWLQGSPEVYSYPVLSLPKDTSSLLPAYLDVCLF